MRDDAERNACKADNILKKLACDELIACINDKTDIMYRNEPSTSSIHFYS